MTKQDISKFNMCACVMQSVQDTSVLSPSVQVEVQTVVHEKCSLGNLLESQTCSSTFCQLL